MSAGFFFFFSSFEFSFLCFLVANLVAIDSAKALSEDNILVSSMITSICYLVKFNFLQSSVLKLCLFWILVCAITNMFNFLNVFSKRPLRVIFSYLCLNIRRIFKKKRGIEVT